ncbi:hypothetical protein HUW46_09244 [Amycolatopsis sp. CA-230715]|nr:hypothetical protein HUW46_09244 [Amycolatopsis sp. CA-230715]
MTPAEEAELLASVPDFRNLDDDEWNRAVVVMRGQIEETS